MKFLQLNRKRLIKPLKLMVGSKYNKDPKTIVYRCSVGRVLRKVDAVRFIMSINPQIKIKKVTVLKSGHKIVGNKLRPKFKVVVRTA